MFKNIASFSAAIAGTAATVIGAVTPIHEIQGEGTASPLANTSVTAQAVVTAVFPGLSGFTIQEEKTDQDNSPTTSEGIFVYTKSASVAVGDLVDVTGIVKEYNKLTEIDAKSINIISNNNALPEATAISLPVSSLSDLEACEGMLVSILKPLTVVDNYNLGRFGELTLSGNGRLFTPTAIVAPGASAQAWKTANDLQRIILDDASSVQNPDPVIFPSTPLSATNTIRVGDQVSNVQGIIHFGFEEYRLLPTAKPIFTKNNPRTNKPDVNGGLTVASFNVLNFFNGNGIGGGFPTSRGASSAIEFKRQSAKIVTALNSINADIFGVMEIENDGYGETSAISELVKMLNQANSSQFAYINPGVTKVGTDEITVGILYKIDKVSPLGKTAILSAEVDSRFKSDKNRPTLAQTFRETATGETFTIAVNHLKSKGSSCDSIGDPDKNDFQGHCNGTRTLAAQALSDWLTKDPTGSKDADFLVIGDMNSYAKEDPIKALESAGFINVIAEHDTSAYSYVFKGESGYLDHALASKSLSKQVKMAQTWHINSDEPHVLDYNTEFKTAGQISSLYDSSAYRSSDHDPVIVAMNLKSGGVGILPKSNNSTIASKICEFRNSLLSLILPESHNVSVLIYNAKGQLIVSRKFDKVTTGVTTIDFGRSIPSGIYFVTVESRAGKTSVKAILK